MKANELIERIKELVKVYGDCEVIMQDEFPINLVRIDTGTTEKNIREIVLL